MLRSYFSSFYPRLFRLVLFNFFHQAYKKLVEREGTEGALPGLGLTEEQLFFVGFARVGIIETSNPLKHFYNLTSNLTKCRCHEVLG